MNWIERISAGLLESVQQGDAVWWALGTLAFVSAAAVIYEALAGSARLVAPAALRVHLFEHLKHGRKVQALQQAQKDNSPFATIARSALRMPEDVPSFMVYSVIEETLNRETALLRARVSFIGGLAVCSMLVGTVGVLGGLLSVLQGVTGSVSAAALAAGAAGAMKAATASGLSAALTAGFYYIFLTRLHLVEALLWSESERLAAMLLGAHRETASPETSPAGNSDDGERAEAEEKEEGTSDETAGA